MDPISFATSVFATVALVSNAVKTFTGLCSAISEKSREDVNLRVKALLFELQSTSRKISDWSQVWVPEKVDSDAYFMLLWGHTGRREIDTSLEKIRARATSIIDLSALLTENLVRDSEAKDSHDLAGLLDWQKASETNLLSPHASAREEIRNSVGELVKRVLELRENTDLHFRSMHTPNRIDKQRPARLEEALASRSVSIAAYDICSKQADVADLELNLLDNESDVDKVADVFDWNDLPPIYHLFMEDKFDTSLMRNVTLDIWDGQEYTQKSCLVGNDIAQKLLTKRTWQCEFCENTMHGKEDIIRHQTFLSKTPSHRRDRLLPYFGQQVPNDGKRVKKPLTPLQKKALGFRVAECALFLLGTPWLAGISRSTLHDMGTFDKDGQFFIRVPLNNINDIGYSNQLSEVHQIRRVGIILVETAIESIWTSGNETTSPTEEMMQRVNDRMGSSYQEACRFCFSMSAEDTKQVSPVSSAGQLLTAFYLNVYLRLRDSYNDLRANTASNPSRGKKGLIQMLKW